ncbi:hypothetical protein K439DRAFT_1610884 [Ramaria rubella]|nr:hypothetical protein K439DRAFT_1610884 [Ramaria rubella]
MPQIFSCYLLLLLCSALAAAAPVLDLAARAPADSRREPADWKRADWKRQADPAQWKREPEVACLLVFCRRLLISLHSPPIGSPADWKREPEPADWKREPSPADWRREPEVSAFLPTTPSRFSRHSSPQPQADWKRAD